MHLHQLVLFYVLHYLNEIDCFFSDLLPIVYVKHNRVKFPLKPVFLICKMHIAKRIEIIKYTTKCTRECTWTDQKQLHFPLLNNGNIMAAQHQDINHAATSTTIKKHNFLKPNAKASRTLLSTGWLAG